MGRRARFRAWCRLQLNRSLVQATCWAHAPRKFFAAVKLNAQDETAIRLVAQMYALFGIEAEARAGGLSPEACHGLRLEKAPLLPGQLKAGLEAARAGTLPQSARAKACHYTLTLW